VGSLRAAGTRWPSIAAERKPGRGLSTADTGKQAAFRF
jgi:hypothetical protein